MKWSSIAKSPPRSLLIRRVLGLVVGLVVAVSLGLAVTVIYTYDSAGRLIQVDYGGGKVITYTSWRA